MYKKSYLVPLLLLVSLLTTTSIITAQDVIRFTHDMASRAEDIVYRQHFKKYTIASLPTEATSDLLRSKPAFNELQLVTAGQTFAFSLQARDLRPAHYKLRVHDETGIHEMPRSANKTYFGYTNGGKDVRITADEDFFYAMIGSAKDEYFIEPARKFIPTAPRNQFVMYWGKDNLQKFTPDACGVTEAHMGHNDEEHHAEDGESGSRDLCKVLQIALANDYEMFQQEGSVDDVESHNLAVINNVETNYDAEFTTDLQFDVVEIYVATSNATDPWTNSTDPNALLDDFTDWGPTGFDNTHDVGGLWTNRNFDGTTIGLAWVGGICNSIRYHALEDFTNNAALLRCLQAHELGHNFNAGHDPEGDPNIMAPSVQNTNTWSTQSQNSINNYIPTRNCLTLCGQAIPPVAAFDANITEGCAPLTVQFTDESLNNPTSWSWVFPGGTPGTSTLENPTVTYNTAGEYNVTLTATNSQGSNSFTETDFIIVHDDPVADFDYQIDELTVDFENLSTGATSYSWNFGDGNTSTQTNPIHEYEEDGVYEVKLTCTNQCGSDFIIIDIEIITLPWADFDATPTDGCDPMEVEFTNYSSSNSNSFLWSFPGGSPPTSTAFEPVVIYETPGTYPVTLTAINDAGTNSLTLSSFITVEPQPNATFTYEADGLEATFNSAGSLGTSYSWNFGDGGVSTNPNPVHIYADGGAYTVVLTVTNPCGTDVFQTQVLITAAPVAAFSSNVTSGCAPLVVQFTNQSIGSVSSFSWVFQGGSPATSNLANPVVTYNTPGVYDVTLTVSNAVGSDVQFNDNYITVHPPTQSAFNFNVNGMQVAFTDLSSNATSWTWTFGDGFTSDDQDPVHIYAQGGTYTVTLVATGICGNSSTSTQVTIESVPVANFSFQQNASCVPATVQFTNQSSSNATGYKWTFEGGTPMVSLQQHPLITYTTAGTFDVQLIVFGAAGNDTLDMPNAISLGNSPDAGFLIATEGVTVTTENISSNATSFEWHFGDGQTSTETHPVHTYGGFGTYTITLIAHNGCGSDTTTTEIVFGTVPNASFSYNGNSGCAPFEVQFIDQSQNNPTSWLWTFDGGNPASSTLQHPVVVYENAGAYSVTLQATNTHGTDVFMLTELIQIANPPDATFDHVVVGNLLSLTYTGVNYDSLHWDFGDGRVDGSVNPTIEYASSGVYEVTLTAYNACGVDTYSVVVNILGTATNDVNANANGWQIRPNPVGDKFFIYGEPLNDGTVNIMLLDVNGKLISQEKWSHRSGPDKKEMQSAHLPSGVFLVRIQDESSSVVLRAVRQ